MNWNPNQRPKKPLPDIDLLIAKPKVVVPTQDTEGAIDTTNPEQARKQTLDIYRTMEAEPIEED